VHERGGFGLTLTGFIPYREQVHVATVTRAGFRPNTPMTRAPAIDRSIAMSSVVLAIAMSSVAHAQPAGATPSTGGQPTVRPSNTEPKTYHVRVRSLPPRSGISWDLALEGGYGVRLSGTLDDQFLGRARVGGLFLSDPWVLQLGVLGELGGLSSAGVGVQGQAVHLRSGFWSQLGGAVGHGSDFVSYVSVGWTLLGVEWQHRYTSTADNALFFKISLPIGLAIFLAQ
jgi:hypothetical protein